MSSFLIKEKTKKSFDEKISKLARKTQDNIHASKRSFERFCPECYDGRNSEEIFNELKIIKEKDQTEALREVLQNWIDWQYGNGSLTSGIQQYLSKIKRVFSHNGIKIHLSDCDEIRYSNFRVIGSDPHGFDKDNDGIGCEVGSPPSSNPVDTTPSCDPSYPDVCIAPYPPDLNCGDIGYSNFRVIGNDPHGFDRDNDGIGCES